MEEAMTDGEQWLRIGFEFDSDTERRALDQVGRMLEQELASADLRVSVSAAPAAFDPSALGPILLLAASTALPLGQAAKLLAPKLLDVLKGWLAKDRRRHVKIRVGKQVLELADAAPEEQRQLVAAFVAAVEHQANH
jgi:hypothetical protein